MEPIHTIEYEMTSALATDIQCKLLRWEVRRGWRRDWPLYVGTVIFAALIIGLGLEGWILPGVGSVLLFLLTFFALGALVRRWGLARMAVAMALLPQQTSDRRVRIDFEADHVRLETERFRGEGTWAELDLVIVFDGFWLLQLTNGGNLIVPNLFMSPQMEEFIRDKAHQVMAPIIQG